MKRTFLCLFFSIAYLIFAFDAQAQTGSAISGRVLDGNGAAVAGASIGIASNDVRFERSAVTDREGRYAFSGLARGSYKLSVSAPGFEGSARAIKLPDDSNVDLTLQPHPVAAELSITSGLIAGTAESLREIPGSVERITPQQLENARVRDFSEALRKISGVSVRDEEGFGLRPNIGIRGTNPTRSTKVLLLEDGLPLSYAPYGDNASYYHPPVERYESIEVLKGSGQIAYGPQTIAGVINYLTPNPPQDPTLNLKLEGGNKNFFNGAAGFGATFGKLGFLTNFSHKRGDGTRENTNFKLYDLSSKATYALNGRNTLTAKFTFFREDSNLTYTGVTEAEYAADPRGNIFKNDFFYGRRYGFSLQHAAVLTSKINLTTNFYSNYFSRDWWRQTSNSNERPFRLRRENDANDPPISDPDCFSLADLNTTCGNRGNLRDYLTTGIEPRLNANFDLGAVRNELNVGFRVHKEDQDRIGKYGDLPTSRDGVLNEDNERKALAYSGFIQNRFIWKDLAFTPGIRIERIEYERTHRIDSVTGKTTVTEVVPGFGIAYSELKNTTLFGGVHRGFAPPRVEDVVTNGGGVVDLDSELSWNYEAGVRTRPVRGIDLAATFFRNDYENQIVAASLAGGIGTTVTNGGETLHQGFEFSGQIDSGTILDSLHNFYFRTAYTFLPIAEFRGARFSTISATAISDPIQRETLCPIAIRQGNSCLVTGNRLPYTPKTTITSSIGYSHPIGIDAFVENVFVGRQFAEDLNSDNPVLFSNGFNGQTGAIPAQTYWNATANYKVEKLRSTFFVTAKNIFDRTLIVDRSRGILPSNGRLVQVGVKISFSK